MAPSRFPEVPKTGIEALDDSNALLARLGEEIVSGFQGKAEKAEVLDRISHFVDLGYGHIDKEETYLGSAADSRLYWRFSYFRSILAQLESVIVLHECNRQKIGDSEAVVVHLLENWFFENFSNAPYQSHGFARKKNPPRLAVNM